MYHKIPVNGSIYGNYQYIWCQHKVSNCKKYEKFEGTLCLQSIKDMFRKYRKEHAYKNEIKKNTLKYNISEKKKTQY